MSFLDNDPKLEAMYLQSEPMDEPPEGAVLQGTIEALAFEVEIYILDGWKYISCVKKEVEK